MYIMIYTSYISIYIYKPCNPRSLGNINQNGSDMVSDASGASFVLFE